MANSNLKSSLSMECKPKLLKDFLNDDSTNDFGSYPGKPCSYVVQNQELIVFKKSKSRAATSTILAIHKASEILIKSLKYFPFASIIKLSSVLPRSVSRKLSSCSRRKKEYDNQRDITQMKVQVKDILRWRSARDTVVEESTPLDLYDSPSICTTITTSASGSTSCSSPLTRKSSSWCDSDFSAEYFPSWCYGSEDCYGENEMKMANMKRSSPQKGIGEGFLEKTIIEVADEQYTPVSVLASPFQDDNKELNYPCKFAKIQSISQMTKFKGHEEVNETEEKAEKLLHHLHETTLPNSCDSFMHDNLLMDFFLDELTTCQKEDYGDLLDNQRIATAQDWLRGINEGYKSESYVEEIEKLKWNKVEEEKEEMALQLEKLVFNSLVDDVLFGLITM